MRSMPTPIDRLLPGRRLKRLAISIFVDSMFWHRCWHCHRLADRSFSLSNRQFHICSRCTGLVLGCFLVPFSFCVAELFRPFFLVGIAAFLFDGLTQLAGYRKSTNAIRFLTGLVLPLSLILTRQFLIIVPIKQGY